MCLKLSFLSFFIHIIKFDCLILRKLITSSVIKFEVRFEYNNELKHKQTMRLINKQYFLTIRD